MCCRSPDVPRGGRRGGGSAPDRRAGSLLDAGADDDRAGASPVGPDPDAGRRRPGRCAVRGPRGWSASAACRTGCSTGVPVGRCGATGCPPPASVPISRKLSGELILADTICPNPASHPADRTIGANYLRPRVSAPPSGPRATRSGGIRRRPVPRTGRSDLDSARGDHRPGDAPRAPRGRRAARSRARRGAAARPLRTGGHRPADLSDRPLQPALHLLHARRGAGLDAARRGARRRRGGPAGPDRRRAAGHHHRPVDRRRAAAAQGPRAPGRRARCAPAPRR